MSQMLDCLMGQVVTIRCEVRAGLERQEGLAGTGGLPGSGRPAVPISPNASRANPPAAALAPTAGHRELRP
jgi:hypothetical protein